MKDSSLYYQASKRLQPGADVDLYMSILTTYPENEWFTPTNGDADRNNAGYTICDEMFHTNLICKQSSPLWIDASYKGQYIEFRYNLEMKY
jgi:hypothetical protein